MDCLLAFTLLLISSATPALSFPSGAPLSACDTLAPNSTEHSAPPQLTDIPYVLNLSEFFDQSLGRFTYNPNRTYNSRLQ